MTNKEYKTRYMALRASFAPQSDIDALWDEYQASKKKKIREYNQRPEVKKKIREYKQRPEVKEKIREYNQRPEVKEKKREYNQRPEVKEKHKAESLAYYYRKKKLNEVKQFNK